MDTKTQNIVIAVLGLILIVCLWFTFNLFGKNADNESSDLSVTLEESSPDIDLDFNNVNVDIDELRARFGNNIDSVYAAAFPEDEEVDYNKLIEDKPSYAEATPRSTRSTYDDVPPYMVIAGAFSSDTNAEIFRKQLFTKGFESAEIVKFNSSKYTSICVSRTDNLSTAKAQVERLKGMNIEAYVHTRKISN